MGEPIDLKEALKEKMANGGKMESSVIQDNVVIEEVKAHNEGMVVEGSSNGALIPTMALDINGAKERLLELQEFIKFMMVPNVDFGFVPGCPKPMLFKSGAEKLCDIYGLTKQIEVVRRVEDWDKGVFHYEVKATLINKRTGCIESEGVGSCNSREKKFAKLDPFSNVNSILKMAKKRAIVDATLAATRTSGIFSQDIENNVA
jgi:hypothetical protein